MKPLKVYWAVALSLSLGLPLISRFHYNGDLGTSLVIGLVMFVMFSILQDVSKTKILGVKKKKATIITLVICIPIILGLASSFKKDSLDYPFSFWLMAIVLFVSLAFVCYQCNINKSKKWEENSRFYYNLLVFFAYCILVALAILLEFQAESYWFYFPLIVGITIRIIIHLNPVRPHNYLVYIALFNVFACAFLVWTEINVQTSGLERLIWDLGRTVSIVNFFSVFHQNQKPQKFFI